MNRKLALKISLFANAGLIMLVSLLAAPSNIRSHATAMDSSGGLSALKHGERSAFRRNGFRHFCSDPDGERLDMAATFVEAKLDLSTAQVKALTQLMDTFQTSATESFATVCADLATDESAATAPERLSRLQAMLNAGSATISEIQPSFETFYASLTETQQQDLNRLLSRRRQHSQDD